MEIVRNAVTAGSDEAFVLVAFFCLYLEILVGQGKKQGPGSAPRTGKHEALSLEGFQGNALGKGKRLNGRRFHGALREGVRKGPARS